jgi:hypothetical protein
LEQRVVFSGNAFVVGSSALEAVDSGLEQPERRIVNGNPSSAFPSVGIVNEGCTGTLISPTHVLTAAHCTVGVSGSAGTFDVGGRTYRTSDIVDHPRYNDDQFDVGYDVSIMELSRPVPNIVPSQILRTAPRVGSMLTLVGFGEGGTSRNGSLSDFGTKRISETELERVTNLHLEWTLDSHTEGNTASGDSGGPAFVNSNGQYLVAGVTSGGDLDAHALGSESFDTRIDVFANWIDSIVGDVDSNPDPGHDPNPDPNTDPNPEPTHDDHDDRPGNSATGIQLVNNVGRVLGDIEVTGDRDAFRVDISEDSEVTISVNSTDGVLDAYLRVYNRNGELLVENDDFGDSLDSRVTIDAGAGTYYFTVGSYADEDTGEYSATIEATPIDTGSNDLFPDAILLDLNRNGRTNENGSIVGRRDEVVYAYESVDDTDFIVRARDLRSGLDTTLTVYDSAGKKIAFNDDFRSWTDSRLRIRGAAGETFYIVVGGYRKSTGNFRLQFQQVKDSRPADFAASRQELAVDQIFADRSERAFVV